MIRARALLCLLIPLALLAGCAPSPEVQQVSAATVGPWTAEIARDLRQHATEGDRAYFESVVDRSADVPDVMRQVAASGIATNYATHFESTSPAAAVLDYGVWAGADTHTFFAVDMRLVGKKWVIHDVHLVY